MGTHALLSPSSAHRWMRCAASAQACANYPDTDSEASLEGTFAHAVAAFCLDRGVRAHTMIGRHAAELDCKGPFVVDTEMAGHLQTYLDFVNSTQLAEDAEALRIETKLEFSDDLHGTADCVIVGRNTLYVVDLKYGAGKLVQADDNEQLQIYGALALQALLRKQITVDTVRLVIVQPRRADDYGNTKRIAPWDPAKLLDWFRNEVQPARTAALANDPPYAPGDHCQWCEHAPNCRALRDQAHAVARTVFAPIADPIAPPLLSPSDLALALKNADILDLWIAAVRKAAFERASAGEIVPGWKVVQKIGNRVWKSETVAEQTLRSCGINPFGKAPLLSPAQAEKALGKKAAPIIAPLVERPVSGTTLVPATDERPAVNAAAVFSPMTDESTK